MAPPLQLIISFPAPAMGSLTLWPPPFALPIPPGDLEMPWDVLSLSTQGPPFMFVQPSPRLIVSCRTHYVLSIENIQSADLPIDAPSDLL